MHVLVSPELLSLNSRGGKASALKNIDVFWIWYFLQSHKCLASDLTCTVHIKKQIVRTLSTSTTQSSFLV